MSVLTFIRCTFYISKFTDISSETTYEKRISSCPEMSNRHYFGYFWKDLRGEYLGFFSEILLWDNGHYKNKINSKISFSLLLNHHVPFFTIQFEFNYNGRVGIQCCLVTIIIILIIMKIWWWLGGITFQLQCRVHFAYFTYDVIT